MGTFTFRLSDAERETIEKNAAKNHLKTAEYIRLKLFSTADSFSDKIDFYQNINFRLAEISKRNLILNQMVADLMVNAYGDVEAEKRQDIIIEQVEQFIKNEGG